MNHTIRIGIVTAAGLLMAACGGTASPPTSSPSVTASAPSPTATPSATSTPAPSAPSTPTPSPTPAPTSFTYVPLYPFRSLAAAQAWQDSYTSGGHQPWHLSPDLTALSFTQGYLGFTGINRVAAHTIGHQDAHVTVGFPLPNGTISRAAIIHLVKYGSGRYAPWEVVGTDDTTLTLATPAYGATVGSPVKVGGTITGVDESLRVDVHQLQSPAVVGSYCCKPGGGQSSPWSVSVSFHAASGQVITIVVHTGGHVAAVERFAVTGVKVA